MNSRSPLLLAALSAAAASTSPAPPGTPEPVAERHWMNQVAAHHAALARAAPTDLVFVGDSITEGWTHAGRDVLALDYNAWVALNLGIGGDRTEHILHRVAGYDFSRANPRLFVLLAGTKNLGKEPADKPEQVAAAVAKIATALQAKSPGSKVLVISILPSGSAKRTGLRERIAAANTALARDLAKTDASYLDIHDQFLTDEGTWKPGLTIDGTHLTAMGYDTLSRALKPEIQRLLDAPRPRQ